MNIKNANDLLKIEINPGSNDQYIYDFISKLNKYYEKYLKKWREEDIEWGLFWNGTNRKNKSITREEEFAKSPLTVLHGPWGSGKTSFIKELIKKWDALQNELKLKNIIYIDLSQHFYSSTDVILEFTEIFYEILLCFLPKDKFNEEEIKKRVSKLFEYCLSKSSWIQNTKNFLYKSYKIAKNEYNPFSELIFDNTRKKMIRKEVEEIVKEIEPTIVVLDNIERLGNSISDIIQIIRFYSYFPNFLFLLPMNKTAIKFTNFEIEEEQIEKYITLDVWFEYKQDYTNLLNNYNLGRREIRSKYGGLDFKYQYVDEINSVLRIPLKNQNNIEYNLTVRQLKKTLEKYNLDNWMISAFSENKYRGFLFLNKFIWKNDVLNQDIKELIKVIEEGNYYSDLINEIFLNKFTNNPLVINYLKDFNYLFNFNKIFFHINFNVFRDEFNECRKILTNHIKDLENDLNTRNNLPFMSGTFSLGNHETVIKSLTTIIEKLDKEISYLEKFKSNYFKQKHEKDLSEIWKLAEEFIELKKKENTLDQVSNFEKELENYVKEKFGYKDNE